jgi:regulator of replication initiation timing
MPAELMSCVEQVMAQGKSKSEAFAICQKSTGLKPHKKKKAEFEKSIPMLLSLADDLDRAGFREEATQIDEILQKEAQWKWFKEKGQQLKDWFKTEQEIDPQKRQILTNIRKTHWDLINKINKAYTLIDNAGKSMHDPATYTRDLNQALDVLQRDLGAALAASQQQAQQADELGMNPQQPEVSTKPVTSPGVQSQVEKFKQIKEEYPAAQEVHYPKEQKKKPSPSESPTEIIPKKSISVSTLLKVADILDEQDKFEMADKIDELIKRAQLGWAKEVGTQMGDKFRSMVGIISESVRQKHYNILNRLKNLYNHLQGLRQSVTSPDYPSQFQAAIQNAQTEFKNLMIEAKQIRQELGQQSSADEAVSEREEVAAPTEEEAAGSGVEFQGGTGSESPFISIKELRKALNALTQDQRRQVLDLIRQLKGQGVQ